MNHWRFIMRLNLVRSPSAERGVRSDKRSPRRIELAEISYCRGGVEN